MVDADHGVAAAGFETYCALPLVRDNVLIGVLGVAVALHRKAVAWAKMRVQGGRPLIEHDGIRAQLAEMKMLIDASRSYIHRACWLADHQEQGWDPTLGALPKAMASQAALQIATWCLEIHGGHGYMKELGVEPSPIKSGLGAIGEGWGRLKPNGRLFGYSPLSRLIERETLAAGIELNRLSAFGLGPGPGG